MQALDQVSASRYRGLIGFSAGSAGTGRNAPIVSTRMLSTFSLVGQGQLLLAD